MLNKEEFIKRSNITHENKYDYSLSIFKTINTKLIILCNKHGEFEQRPKNHYLGQGCPKCSSNKKYTASEEFVNRSKIVHKNKYDYSLTNYKKNNLKVKIICYEHGIFEQLPNNHLNMKQGCPECKHQLSRLKLEEFIKESNIIHDNKYDYSLLNTESFNFKNKAKIICHKHGIFEQLPNNHKNLKHGCKFCRESKGEKKIEFILKRHNIHFIREFKFDNCKNKNHLPFDFYLPEKNVCIEYQGEQHFKPINHFGGKNRLKSQQKNDKIKLEFCHKNNIKLILINYFDDITTIIDLFLKG